MLATCTEQDFGALSWSLQCLLPSLLIECRSTNLCDTRGNPMACSPALLSSGMFRFLHTTRTRTTSMLSAHLLYILFRLYVQVRQHVFPSPTEDHQGHRGNCSYQAVQPSILCERDHIYIRVDNLLSKRLLYSLPHHAPCYRFQSSMLIGCNFFSYFARALY